MDSALDQKSVLDLALELGVRTETIVSALESMGLPADEDTTIDPDLESALIDQMASDGTAASSLQKGKGRRKLTDEPVVDDDILTEALGSSETGFSDSNIPRQLLLETAFEEKPSFFERLFKKKRTLASSLQDRQRSDDEIESIFTSKAGRRERKEISPFEQIDRTETPAEAPALATEEPGVEPIELDEDIFEDMEGIDLEDDIEIEGIETEQTEREPVDETELDTGMDIDLDEVGDEELELEGEELEDVTGEEGGEGETGTSEGGAEEEEPEEAKGFIGRMLSRVQLTPAEMWTLMGGSILVMVILLGITFYWWKNASPRAKLSLYDQSVDAYQKAADKEIASKKDNKIKWSTVASLWETSADLNKQFIDKFPSEFLPGAKAFQRLCDSHYHLATGYEKEGEDENKAEAYRTMVQYYEKYLTFLDKLANQMVNSNNPGDAFVDVDEQRTALKRIAMAQAKLERFENAIERLEEFADRYRNTSDAFDVLIQIGQTYEQWSKVNKEEELQLLRSAIDAYAKANNEIPEEQHQQRMRMFSNIGNIQYTMFERSRAEQKEEEATNNLNEAIAYYEKADQEARLINMEDVKLTERSDAIKETQHVFKRLGDLYLNQGKESGLEWRKFEEDQKLFPDSTVYKQKLVEAAQREKDNTMNALAKATNLYDYLLENSEYLSPEDLEDINYNKTNSYYIMRDYPKAIATGEAFLNSENNEPDSTKRGETRAIKISDETKTKIHYLLGHAAWEDALTTQNYSKVQEHYLAGLKLDPLYPAEAHGEDSNLAEIRVINSVYIPQKRFQEAIDRFQKTIERYPGNAYTFLTLVWYAKALEDYGDELNAQAAKKEEEATLPGSSPNLRTEAQTLRDEAKKQFEDAETKYGRAKISREGSKFIDTQNKQYLIRVTFAQGHSAFKAGPLKYRTAEQYLKNALKEFRDSPVAQQYLPAAIERLGDINVLLGNFQQAIDYYQEYLDNAFEDTDMKISMKLAEAYLKQMSFDKAREYYRKILQNDPPPTEKQIRQRLAVGGKVEKGPGFEALKKIAESFYSEAKFAVLDERREKLEDTLAAFQELVNKYPITLDSQLVNDPNSLRQIAAIHYELGNFQLAVDNYEQFLLMSPNFRRGPILKRIADCYMEMKNFDKVIEILGNIEPVMMDNSSQYADVLILQGRANEFKANDVLNDPKNAVLYDHYMDQARLYYSKVSGTGFSTDKINEAHIMRKAIDSIIDSRRELVSQ